MLTKRKHQCHEYNATLRHVFFLLSSMVFICIVIYSRVIMTFTLGAS